MKPKPSKEYNRMFKRGMAALDRSSAVRESWNDAAKLNKQFARAIAKINIRKSGRSKKG